jgi:hypothetical protein
VLLGYDLVFAKGRSALEALGIGAAVVLCDTSRVGPMVTTENVERLRKLNFGIRALRDPLDPGAVSRQIAGYNAADAAQVCAWVRHAASMDDAVHELVSLYREVIEEYKRMPPPGAAAEMRAASNYLRHWIRFKHELDRSKEEFQMQLRAKRERRHKRRHRFAGISRMGTWLKSLARFTVGRPG